MDVSDIFVFSARERGRGSPRHREGGGDRFSIENPRKWGGGSPGRGPRGWGGSAANWGIGGGGLNFFFRAEMSTKINFSSIIGRMVILSQSPFSRPFLTFTDSYESFKFFGGGR